MMQLQAERLATATVLWVASGAIKASIVLVLSFCISRWRGLSAATRHAIWCTTIVGVLVMPVLRSTLPAWNVAILPAHPDLASGSGADVAAPTLAAPQDDLGESSRSTLIVDVPPAGAAPVISGDVRTFQSVGDSPRVHAPSLTESELLAIVWGVGVLVVLFPWVIGTLRLQRLWSKAAPGPLGAWGELQHLLPSATSRVVALRVSELTTVPMTWGVWRPKVLVPAADQWSSTERRAALLHELAHVARWDALWQSLSRLAKAMFWFNPLVWLADAMLRSEAERACDDAVLRSGARASDYAQQLVDVLRTTGGRRPSAAAALSMARRSGMAGRLRAVLAPGAARGALSRRSQASIVALAGVVGIPLARLTPVADSPGLQPAAMAAATLVTEGESASSRPSVIAMTASDAGRRASEVTGELATGTVPPAGLSRAVGSVVTRGLTPSGEMPVADSRLAVSVPLQGNAAATAQDGCLFERGAKSSSMSVQSRDGKRSMHVKWTTGTCRVTFDVDGELTFNSDASDVVALSRGGSLDLYIKDGSRSRRLTLEENRGALDRKYWVNDERQPWDAAAAAWFSRALVALDHRTAFAVDQRLPALLKAGGVDRVLAEVEEMNSDYAARVYYTKLFKVQTLSAPQVQRVLAHAATQVESDYERAELLLEVAKLGNFSAESHVAFAGAAGGIKSDYEKRRALTALLAKRGLSMPAVKALLGAAQGMGSDYELAELLVAVSGQYAISDDTRPLYLAALGTLESDYEHRRVLDAIVAAGGLTPAATRDLLQDASRIKSDYELAEFLVKVAASGTIDAGNTDAFFSAASAVQGDYESHRVLTSVLQRNRVGKDLLMRVIEASRQIKSDYERASLLVEAATTGPIDEAVLGAYERAASGIKSEYEYGRAMAAIRRARS